MRKVILSFALVLAGAAAAHAQVPTVPLLSTTTTSESTTTTTTAPPEETTTPESEVNPSPDLTVGPPPESSPPSPVAVDGNQTSPTSVARPASTKPRSSVASALTGAFAVAIATVFAVGGIFVSLSIRSRVRR